MDSNANHATHKHNHLREDQDYPDDHRGSKLRVVGDPDSLCGCGTYQPQWMQYFANPKLFTAHCTAIVALLICGFAYLGAVLTTIERQFKLSSTESGSLSVINDVVSLSLVLFVSYFGHKSHRPRWIATGTVLCAIGSFLCTMPHYAFPPLDPDDLLYGEAFRGASVCKLDSNTKNSPGDIPTVSQQPDGDQTGNYSDQLPVAEECVKSSSTFGPVWWIIFGNVLNGIGQSGMYPLMTTYIDDAVGKRRLVSYTGKLSYSIIITKVISHAIFCTTRLATKKG